MTAAPAATAAADAWAGLVLAGGRSLRMGRDKALLEWHGRPLLAHMQALLRDAGAQRVVVSGAYPAFDGLPDLSPGGGPMSALAQVAPRLPDGVWLVVPVDMPLLSRELLHALATQPAVCAAFEGHPLPMRLQLDATTRPILADVGSASGPACSLRNLQAALRGARIDAAPWQAQLANCNTPEQWRQLSGER